MKKLILSLLFMCVGVSTFGSGKLVVSPSYYVDTKSIYPQIGLSVYEPIGLGLVYNSYTGGGVVPRIHQSGINWFATRHDIETNFGDFTVGVGATLRLMFQEKLPNENENNFHITASYKIW